MKALAIYPIDTAYPVMSRVLTHILVPVEAYTVTQAFAPVFQDQLTRIRLVSAQEDDLALAVARAEGLIISVDAELDVLVTRTLDTVANTVGKTSALYLFLLGDKTPGAIRAPVLDEELEIVSAWIDQLQACPEPSVQACGVLLKDKVTVAEKRVKKLADAEQALEVFRALGPRKQLVDDFNDARIDLYMKLQQLAGTPAGVGLPADFHEVVFEYERASRRRKHLTAKELEKLITQNEAEHTALGKQLVERKAEDAADAKAKAKKKAKPTQEALDIAKKKAAELQAQIAALEASLPPPSSP